MSAETRIFTLQCVANIACILAPAREKWLTLRTPGYFKKFLHMRDKAEEFYERLCLEE